MTRARKRIVGVLSPEQWQQMNRVERRRAQKEGYLPPMAGGALESNIMGLWAACQTDGKGSPATMTAGEKRFRWVGGDIQANRADGTEQYSDNTLFGDSVDFVNTLEGNGAPVIQGQSGILAYLSWLAAGQETVSSDEADCVQTLSSTATGGHFHLSTTTGYKTAEIPNTATAVQVSTALLAMTNPNGGKFPPLSVSCTGGPLPTTPIVITFEGPLAKQPVPLLVVDNTAATGGTAVAAMTTPGKGWSHEITPADSGGFYSTWVKSVGESVVARHQFNDCRITTIRYEGSSASKVLKVTPTWVSFDPGIISAADPTKDDDGTRPFIWTEAAGTVKIDGEVYRGNSSFAAEAQWALTPWFGDDVVPYDVVSGRATLLLQAITILMDTQGLERYNCQIYDTPTPATDTKPITTIPSLGSYENTFSRTNPYTGGVSESFKFEALHVKWDPNLNIPANPAGGPVELPMAAEQRKDPLNPTDPAYRITVVTPYDDAYVGPA
jgi:hypothetical protein